MIKSFFAYCEASFLAETIRGSVWLFPTFQVFHLIGLAILTSAVLIGDLRLMRLMFRGQPIRLVGKSMQPLLIGGFVLTTFSGTLQFVSEAMKCYYNDAFKAKMTCLLLATLFTVTIRRKVLASSDSAYDWKLQAIVGFCSTLLWFGVGLSGRWIAFI